MKLSQDQINHIESYLVKHKVRYWDVRMELLDHICKATEDRMAKGMSFNDALMQAHIDFGNDPIKERLNKDNTKWETYPDIYADSSVYKELIKLKYQKLHNSFTDMLVQDFKKFFTTPLTLFLYVIIIGLLWYFISQTNDNKLIFRITMIPPILIVLVQIIIGFLTYKRTFKSLYILTAWSVGNIGLTLQSLAIQVHNMFFSDENKSTPIWLLLGSTMVLLPLIYVGLALYLKELRKYTRIQNKLV